MDMDRGDSRNSHQKTAGSNPVLSLVKRYVIETDGNTDYRKVIEAMKAAGLLEDNTAPKVLDNDMPRLALVETSPETAEKIKTFRVTLVDEERYIPLPGRLPKIQRDAAS